MKKLVNPLIEKAVQMVQHVRSSIMPFCEQPAEIENEVDIAERKTISPVDLFSFFTADIIKKKTVFTR